MRNAKVTNLICLSAVVATATIGLPTSGLLAQNNTPSDGGAVQSEIGASPDTAGDGDIIVTATRRPQSLSQVPTAISAYSGETLQNLGLIDTQDLSQASPSLNLTTGSTPLTSTEIRIRGIGTAGGANPGLEPSVGIFVDGVYRSRTGLAVGDLLDISSVEILRGPQGTLFGRNTSAGTLNFNTKQPEFDFGGYVEAGLQNYSGFNVTAGLTGPLVDDRLAFRFAISHNSRDGFVRDRLVPSRDYYDRNRTSARAQLLWRPSEVFDIRLILDYQDKNETCCAADYLVSGPTSPAIVALGGIVEVDPFSYQAQQSFTPEDDLEEGGISIEANWSIGDSVDLTWVGAYREADAYTTQDPDQNSVDIVQGTDWRQNNEFMSQELRLKGVAGRLDWLVGAFYFEDEFDVDWQITYGSQFGAYFNLLTTLPAALFPEGFGDTARVFNQRTTGWALFTHNIVDLGNDFDLVLGFRYSEETKDAATNIATTAIHCDIVPSVPFCPVASFAGRRTEEEPSGTIKIVKNLPIGNVYAGYSRGYKSGGFNLDRDAVLTSLEFEPEIVDTFEVGAKWSTPDRKVNLTADIFHSIFKDYQINEFNGIGFATTNAAEVQSTGVELSVNLRPLPGLTIDGGATWVDSRFEENPNVNNVGEPLEGKNLPFSPKLSMTGSAQYEHYFGALRAFAIANASYFGPHNIDTNLSDETNIDGYALVNARLGISSQDEDWQIALWVRNIFDTDVRALAFPAPLQAGSFITYRGQPRMYGVTTRFAF